jgi:hypothetical protein
MYWMFAELEAACDSIDMVGLFNVMRNFIYLENLAI